ncbi:MAG: hypothetical protein ACLRXC_11850 [[Clostridium] leptum]
MNIGIDHGYYAIKTRHFSFPAGIAEYSHEPYTLQNTLEFGGKFYVCGTGRQPILRNKMENDNYYLLTLAAIAKEIKQRGGKTECSVRIAAGLPLADLAVRKSLSGIPSAFFPAGVLSSLKESPIKSPLRM